MIEDKSDDGGVIYRQSLIAGELVMHNSSYDELYKDFMKAKQEQLIEVES